MGTTDVFPVLPERFILGFPRFVLSKRSIAFIIFFPTVAFANFTAETKQKP
jgi:hypothetical protein